MPTFRERFIQLANNRDISDEAYWDIITALRGPDFYTLSPEMDSLKRAITAVIRWHLLGIEARGDSTEDTEFSRDLRMSLVTFRPDGTYRSKTEALRHFLRHAMNAFYALGLKWDEVNKIE